MAQKLRDLMTATPVTLEPGSTLRRAAEMMRDDDVGDVLVVESDHLRGMVTDRDIVVRALAAGMDPTTTTVGEVMTADLDTLGPDDDVARAVEIMRRRAVRRLPVVEEGRPIGIVSIGDLAIERDESSALADISAAPPKN